MAKHSAWVTFNRTRKSGVGERSSGMPDQSSEGSEVRRSSAPEFFPVMSESVCPRCGKFLDGRISETLDGDRVHTACYVRGGRR